MTGVVKNDSKLDYVLPHLNNNALNSNRSNSVSMEEKDGEKGIEATNPHSELSNGLEGAGTVTLPFVVKFLDGDMENPMNWKASKRWITVFIVAFETLCVTFGSSTYAGEIEAIGEHFGSSETVLILGLSLYILGFVFGPLIFAPCSEMFGRRLVFVYSFIFFVFFQIGSALSPNIESLLIFRFLSGFFGSAPLTNSGGVIADMFSASERALALTAFAMAPFLGPCLGPAVGGFMGETVNFRDLFWLMTGFSATMYCIGYFVSETYAPVLLRWRATEYSARTGQVFVSEFDIKVAKNETLLDKLKLNLTRPFILLFREPIVFLLSLYTGLCYAIMYLFISAFPEVFQIVRHMSAGVGGLAFLGLALGFLVGSIMNFYENKRYGKMLIAAGGRLPPEARLRIAAIGGVMISFGLFGFAWTAAPESIHFIVPILFTSFFGAGILCVFMASTNYLIDCYLYYAASALAANAVLRSLLGAIFPLFTVPMFTKLGVNWALTLIAFLSLMCVPIPFVFIRYGAFIRSKSKFAPGHGHVAAPTVSTKAELESIDEVRQADLAESESEAVDIAMADSSHNLKLSDNVV